MAANTWSSNIWSGNRRNLFKVGTVGVSAIGLSRLISACGGSTPGNPLDGPIAGDMAIVQRWVPDQLGPGRVRLPVSLADNDGLLMKGPETLNGKVLNYLDNSLVVDDLVAQRRWLGEGTAPFWVFEAEANDVAMYSIIVEGGPADGAAFQIRDPQNLVVVNVDESLPAFDTPTVSDHRGVEPYCTRLPVPCPFHEMTLADALATGKRIVFMVGTPAHCQTGVCAPVLDGLIEVANDFSDVIFIHADVYADETATTTAPVVDALNLTFEPVLWVTDTSGVITHRFEGVWHPDEVREVLA
jgi:hypothetical protein